MRTFFIVAFVVVSFFKISFSQQYTDIQGTQFGTVKQVSYLANAWGFNARWITVSLTTETNPSSEWVFVIPISGGTYNTGGLATALDPKDIDRLYASLLSARVNGNRVAFGWVGRWSEGGTAPEKPYLTAVGVY